MSETFKATREGIQKLRHGWMEASEDTKFEFIWWAISILGMWACVIWAFGWPGFWFGIFLSIKQAMDR